MEKVKKKEKVVQIVPPKCGTFFCFPKNSKKGFTLIEILLVVGIFSVVVGVLFPNLRQFYVAAQFENTVKEVSEFINYGKSKAFMDQNFLRFSLDLYERKMVLEQLETEEGRRGEYVPVKGRYGKGKKLPYGMRFLGNTTREIFIQPDGGIKRYEIGIERGSDFRATIKGDGYFGNPKIEWL